MLDIIKDKFTNIATKCATRYAKEEGTMREKIQLVFKLSGDGSEVEYVLYKDYKPLKKITFMQVLGVKIDLMGYSLYVPKFIRGSLVRFCETYTIEPKNVRVMLSIQENEDVFMYLYNGGEFLREVELESLFNPEDAVIDE
jgi:hypothetical protein